MKIKTFCLCICLFIVTDALSQPLAIFPTEQLEYDGYYTFISGSPAVAQEFVAQQPYVNVFEIHGLIPQDTQATHLGGAVVFYKSDDFQVNGTQAEVIYGHSVSYFSNDDCTAEYLPDFITERECTLALDNSFTAGTWIHNNVPLEVGESYTFVLYMSPGVELRASRSNAYSDGGFYQLNVDYDVPGGLVPEAMPEIDLWFRLGLVSDPLPRVPAQEFRIQGTLEAITPSGTPGIPLPNLNLGDHFEATFALGFDGIETSNSAEMASFQPVQSHRLELTAGNYFFEFQDGWVDMQNREIDVATFVMNTMVHSSLGRGAYANRAVLTVADHTATVFDSLQYTELFKLADFNPSYGELLLMVYDSGDNSGDLETVTDGYQLRFSIDGISAVAEHNYAAIFELQNGATHFYARAVTFDEAIMAEWKILADDHTVMGEGTGEAISSPYLYFGRYEVELRVSNNALHRSHRQWFSLNHNYRKLQHPTFVTQTKDSDGDGGRDTFLNNPDIIELATSEHGVSFAGIALSDSFFFSNNATDDILYLQAELVDPGTADNWVHVWLKDYSEDNAEMLVDGLNNTRWLGSFQPQDYTLGPQRFRLNPSKVFSDPQPDNRTGYKSSVILTSTASAENPVVLTGIKPEAPFFSMEPRQMPGTSSSSSSSSSSTSSTSTSSSSTSSTSTTSSSSTSSSSSSSGSSSSSSSSTSSSGGGSNYPLECEMHIYNEWEGGALVGVNIHNAGDTTVNGWRVWFKLDETTTLHRIWNAKPTNNAVGFSAAPKNYNRTMYPGARASFGFILKKPEGGSPSLKARSRFCLFE